MTDEAPPSNDSPAPLEPLSELLQRLENDPAPRNEYHFRGPFDALTKATEERGEIPSTELLAELIAFSMHPVADAERSPWGIRFGPFMSGPSPSGGYWESPALSRVTEEMLAYWRERAAASTHPVMKARYADLLWELPRSERFTLAKPDGRMARVAADSYLDSIEQKRYESEVVGIAAGKRALEIALLLHDKDTVERARDVLLAYEKEIADDGRAGLWGFCFDLFVEPPSKRVPLSEDQRNELVSDMEARLKRISEGDVDVYHPQAAEAAAIRLANHYRRVGNRAEAARVLRVYGAVVRRMEGAAAPIVFAGALEQLYDLFKSFELHGDADALSDLIRTAGEESFKNLKPMESSISIPTEQVEAYFAAMLRGGAAEILNRIAVHFVPKRDELEEELRNLAQEAPIQFLMSRTIVNDEGRTLARVGSLEDDMEGNVLHHLSQNLHFSVPWLSGALARGRESGVLTAEAILEHLFSSPFFPAKRRVVIEAGVQAYAREDSISAIHILVPQVEEVLRQVAIVMGAPLYTQRRGGGFHARTLDDLLRDEGISKALEGALGGGAVTYLRALFTDARGWNVRNDVCHGLASIGSLGQHVADRVLHALLMLALLRRREE